MKSKYKKSEEEKIAAVLQLTTASTSPDQRVSYLLFSFPHTFHFLAPMHVGLRCSSWYVVP
jgi:hypothetical protein